MYHLIVVSLKEILQKYTIDKEINLINQIKMLNLFSVKTTIIIKSVMLQYLILQFLFSLEFNITVRKNDDTNFHHEDPVRLVNNGFAYCFKEARLSTTIGSDIEINKFCGQVSTIMRAISNKDGDLLSQFDNINENDIPIIERLADLPPQIRSTPHQKLLIDNHTDANRGKIKGYLYLEDIFDF